MMCPVPIMTVFGMWMLMLVMISKYCTVLARD